MKTIAVLTDLSKSAAHAAQFALHIARRMKANVLLFQVCEVPVARQLVLAGMPESQPDDGSELAEFANQMHELAASRIFKGYFQPEVLICDTSTELVDVMTMIMNNEDVCLVVTAPGNERDVANYMLSDACNRIIDWARVPVLVVPESAPLRNPEKIAYVSHLHEEDINSIAELGNLMESFAAELMVAHLNVNPSDMSVKQQEDELNRELYRKVNSGGVYFRSIPDLERAKSWDWLKANKRTELLAVMQQPREIMSKFFTRGHNQAVTYHLAVPVIVLPKRP
ncbi:MAG: universal stress protein [Bacteroidota bacterium]